MGKTYKDNPYTIDIRFAGMEEALNYADACSNTYRLV